MTDYSIHQADNGLSFALVPVPSNPMQPVMPLLFDQSTGTSVCVDPADASLAQSAAQSLGWKISKIFVTHHHNDHTAGVTALKAATGAEVWGPKNEAISGVDHKVASRDWVEVGSNRAMVYECPGHTKGHIVFHFLEAALLVAGDSLFTLGCGRLNEGTPADMWGYLSQLRQLPDNTRIICGHNYTGGNLAFTRAIVGNSLALDAYQASLPDLGMPKTMGEERDLNLFLNADRADVAAALQMQDADPIDVFGELRRRKDQF